MEYKLGKEVTCDTIKAVLDRSDEIVLNEKINSYFHVGMYLKGESFAKEVRRIITD